MKRRDFFQMMGGFVAGCALAVQAVSRLPQKILNPVWVDAPYEMIIRGPSRGIASHNPITNCILPWYMFSQVDPMENICETQPRFDANSNRVPRFVVG